MGSETLPYYTRNIPWNFDKTQDKYLPINSYAKSKEYAIGHILWAGITYLGEAGGPWPTKGWESCPINTAGFKNTYFHYIQSLYTEEPMVHIGIRDTTDHRVLGKTGWHWPALESHWNWEHEKPLEVQVYSNCEKVSLYLNDQLLETKTEKDPNQGFFKFNVKYQQGHLKAVGFKKRKRGRRIRFAYRLQNLQKFFLKPIDLS